jgi:hypothetical protein
MYFYNTYNNNLHTFTLLYFSYISYISTKILYIYNNCLVKKISYLENKLLHVNKETKIEYKNNECQTNFYEYKNNECQTNFYEYKNNECQTNFDMIENKISYTECKKCKIQEVNDDELMDECYDVLPLNNSKKWFYF